MKKWRGMKLSSIVPYHFLMTPWKFLRNIRWTSSATEEEGEVNLGLWQYLTSYVLYIKMFTITLKKTKFAAKQNSVKFLCRIKSFSNIWTFKLHLVSSNLKCLQFITQSSLSLSKYWKLLLTYFYQFQAKIQLYCSFYTGCPNK